LLGRNAGILAVVAFLRGIAASRFNLVALTDSDLERVAEILEKYADSRIDFVDASVMAVAERYVVPPNSNFNPSVWQPSQRRSCNSP